MSIINNIKSIRIDRGLSQEQIADLIDVGYATYSRIERQLIPITYDRLERLAKVFNMDVCDIIHYPHRWGPVGVAPEPRSRRPSVEIDTHLSSEDVHRLAHRVVELLREEGLLVKGKGEE